MSLIDLSILTPYKSMIDFKEGGTIWSITSLYLHCLKKYESKKTKKVVIEISENTDNENTIEYMLDVIKISCVFDFGRYYNSDNYGKKKMLLDILQSGLMKIAKSEGWDTNQLLDAYNCCLVKNLEHKWLRNDKYFLSPDRKYYAGIFCNWDIDKFEAFAVFLNRKKEEIKRIKLFETEPWDVERMGKMGWDKNTGEFYMYSKDERKRWTASINFPAEEY